MPAVLRVESESGETWEDPSEDLLFMMLGELGPDNSFLIVERLDVPDPAETYMQVLRLQEGGYVVEYRDGTAERHFQARVRSMRRVHDILTRWAFLLPGWERAVRWARLDME